MKQLFKNKMAYSIGLISPKWLAKIRFKRVFGKSLNLHNPQDLNEKIQWLKLYSDTSRWPDLADKYKVRTYVQECGCGELLNELYGKWDHADEIDFDKLPDSFVLKTNHGCGTVLLVEDKSKLDINKTRKLLNRWLKTKYGVETAENHYLKIQPCIIAEKILKHTDGISSSLIDYKFFCLNGEPYVCLVCYDRVNTHPCLGLYDIKEWKSLDYNIPEKKRGKKHIPRPTSLDQMIRTARLLSKGFPAVRVDLYEIDEKPVFGELTFTSYGGFMDYFTPEYLLELGNQCTLPAKAE